MKQINAFVKEFINDGYKPIKDSFSCVKNEKYAKTKGLYTFFSNEKERGVLYGDFAKIILDKTSNKVLLYVGDLFVKENLSLTQKRFFESVLNYRMLNFKYVVKNDNIFNEIQKMI